jgi:hypothetical protein
MVSRNLFFKFFYFYLLLKKIGQKKYFSINEKQFLKFVKNLEMLYYLLIILNLIIKLLIVIYILF